MQHTESPRHLQVFLCYSHEDTDRVRELYRRLREAKVDPWLDKEKLLPGQVWEEETRKALRKSDVVVVCLSRASTKKAGYRQKEIGYALDLADEQPEGSIYIIPLQLEECDLPERLSRWHSVEYFEERGHERLILSLQLRAQSIDDEVIVSPRAVSSAPAVPAQTDEPVADQIEVLLDEVRALRQASEIQAGIRVEYVIGGEIGDHVYTRAQELVENAKESFVFLDSWVDAVAYSESQARRDYYQAITARIERHIRESRGSEAGRVGLFYQRIIQLPEGTSPSVLLKDRVYSQHLKECLELQEDYGDRVRVYMATPFIRTEFAIIDHIYLMQRISTVSTRGLREYGALVYTDPQKELVFVYLQMLNNLDLMKLHKRELTLT